MNNNIITAAIATQNEANFNAAKNKAGCLISRIQQLRTTAEATTRSISELQKEIVKMNSDVLTTLSVVGGALPTTAHTEVIESTIASINKAKQDEVAAKTARLTSGITSQQSVLADLNRGIAELVKELGEVKPVIVTESEITGN